ncbi:MAG: phage holin family protein [Candidatus Limnocylindrales bacterium]
MKQLLRLAGNAVALAVVVYLVPGLTWVDETPLTIVITALIFGVINTAIKPLLRLLSLPIRLVTLGLFGFVINIGLLFLLAWVGDQIGRGVLIAGWPAEAFSVDALIAAALAAILLSIFSTVLSLVIRD